MEGKVVGQISETKFKVKTETGAIVIVDRDDLKDQFNTARYGDGSTGTGEAYVERVGHGTYQVR